MSLSLNAVATQTAEIVRKPIDKAMAQLSADVERRRQLEAARLLSEPKGYLHNCARRMQIDAAAMLAWNGEGAMPSNVLDENARLSRQVEQLQGELAAERRRIDRIREAQIERDVRKSRVIHKLLQRHSRLFARFVALKFSRQSLRAAA